MLIAIKFFFTEAIQKTDIIYLFNTVSNTENKTDANPYLCEAYILERSFVIKKSIIKILK